MEDVKDVEMLLDNLEDSTNQIKTQPQQPSSPPDNSFQNFKQSSLVSLTQKFQNLIHDGNGVVDLNFAAVALGVPKRRIYDITNVLEGIGLLTKQGPLSKVFWKGELEVSPDERERLDEVRAINDQLKAKEEYLDTLLNNARKNNQVVFNHPAHQPYSFVSRDDLVEAMPDQTIFAVQKDKNTELDKTAETLNLFLDTGSVLDVRLLTDNGYCMELIDTDDSDSSPVHVSKKRKMSDNQCSSEDEGISAEKIFHKPSYKSRIDFDPSLDNSPIVSIHPPLYDPCLDDDEGLCDLFDIKI